MRLVTVQDYSIHHKVSKQSVYARISSGSLKAVIKDNIKYVQDESRNEITEDQEDGNIQAIEIKHLKKEIKRLKKDLKKSEKKRERSDDRIDQLLDLMLTKKEIPFKKDEVIDVALVQKKKKKKKR